MKTQSGFTLIEMVAVIIILAIMAATALPKFVNLSNEARMGVMQSLAGSIRSAATMTKAKWLAQQSNLLANVNYDGTQMVSVLYATTAAQSSMMGYPTNTATGIVLALDIQGANIASGADLSDGWAFWPATITTSANCYVLYNSGTVTHPADGNWNCS